MAILESHIRFATERAALRAPASTQQRPAAAHGVPVAVGQVDDEKARLEAQVAEMQARLESMAANEAAMQKQLDDTRVKNAMLIAEVIRLGGTVQDSWRGGNGAEL